ncbi:MAG: sigma 54-interacting transcriptional regulator [Firmicutes bacterium]|jgi:propionate catabolism regulator PrpR|nr:sigma 54-interacting transcriptional regulator [Bacillota bacterium]
MRPRIGIVAPYQELANLCSSVCSELGEDAEVRSGDLSEGVAVAREMERAGAEVIISRGGTALAIERALEIPVVLIEVSPLDLLKALAQAKELGRSIGVVGFKNTVYGAEDIAEILDIDLVPIVLASEAEAESRVAHAVRAGLEVIVGDAVAARTAVGHGARSVLIRSGKDAIMRAIAEAKHVAAVRMRERERAQELRAILDFAHEGIIGLGPDGAIRVFNPVAERVFGMKAQEAMGRNISALIPDVSMDRLAAGDKAETGELSHIGETLIITTRVPIRVRNEVTGAVITFQDVTRIQQLEEKVRKELHTKGHTARYTFANIKTASAHVKELVERAKKFARVDSTVLITGETGTGKELFAQSIHNESARRGFPFVAINCAAVPESLLESELFGYEEGAFTGARRGGKQGLFEQAHRGTIFLDEIGEMSMPLQSRLLRVLEEREVMRVGGDRIIPVNVRIIAATHVDLKEAMARGEFREDLYYRLNKLSLRIPPLRERPEDIPVFASLFLEMLSERFGRPPQRISADGMRVLTAYSWPGNVRELRNIIERIVTSLDSETAGAKDIRALMHDEYTSPRRKGAEGVPAASEGTLAEMERQAIESALSEAGGNKREAARILGISRATLWRKLKTAQHE